MLHKVSKENLQFIQGAIEYTLGNLQQVDIQIKHDLCGDLYFRHCVVPKGVAIISALVKVQTLVIINGDCLAYDGQKVNRITGYKVLQGQAYRQSVFRALQDTHITMIAVVKAKTVQDAQKEITDQYLLLTNNREKLCQQL